MPDDFLKKEDVIKIVDGRLGDRWGHFVETLLGGNLINNLNERNIKVNKTYKREKGFYEKSGIRKEYEFDLVAKNGNEVVIVEVKVKLRNEDIKKFITKLKTQAVEISDYKDNKIYGAVAYLDYETGADTLASSEGLFVIDSTGNSPKIVNIENFNPTNFSKRSAS